MPFKSGLNSVNSDPAYIKIGGVLPIGLDAKAVDGYNPVFRTKLIENGFDEKGNPFYKTELIKYNNKKDASSFNEGTVIATGSTKPGEKNFEFNENASEIDKKFEERIYSVQKRSIKQIIKDDNRFELIKNKEKNPMWVKVGVDKSPQISYIGYMKEKIITISSKDITPKQWSVLLLELNIMRKAWKPYAKIELSAPGLKKIITNGTRRYDAKKD